MRNEKCIIIFDIIALIALGIIHFVFSFFIKAYDFDNIIDALDSSPLYNFELNDNCNGKSNIVFHTWEGRKEKEYYYSRGHLRSREKTVDVTDIKVINGYKFCYDKKKSYRELLYNDQIIKKGENCKINYKNCGTIDTLEQELCVKEDEDCPLYDVRIVDNNFENNDNNYYTQSDSNIYYNNENYYMNVIDKKIIGKLILNDGQPCYNINEKLWRKFSSDEAGDEHLKCELKIFGKYNDDRYENVGKISYSKIYQDNLITDESRQLFNNIDDSYQVSLYKREFLGIDKECHDNSDNFENKYNKLKNSQESEAALLMSEGIIIFLCFIICVLLMRKGSSSECLIILLIVINVLNLIACIICDAIFLSRMIQYRDISYECSDSITNEVLKNNTSNNKKQILFTALNLGFDVALILGNILAFVIDKIIDNCYYPKISFPRVMPSLFDKNANNNNNNNINKKDNDKVVNKINTANLNMAAPGPAFESREVFVEQCNQKEEEKGPHEEGNGYPLKGQVPQGHALQHLHQDGASLGNSE